APHGCPGRHGAVQDGNVRYRSDLVTPPSSPQRRPATVRENRDWWRMEGTVLNLARLNIWSSRRRPGSRQGKGAPLRADASTPAPQTPPSVRAEATSSSDTWVSGSAPVRAEATSSSDTWVSGSAPQPQLRMYLRIHCPKAIGTE